MRGKARAIALTPAGIGITPAHAGKSSDTESPASSATDHPRTCGEKPDQSFILLASRGSPPHMRGKGIRIYIIILKMRITPAHAGKSLSEDIYLNL